MIGSGCIQAHANVIDDDGLSWCVLHECVCALIVLKTCAVSGSGETLLSFWFSISVYVCSFADHHEQHDLTKLLLVHPHRRSSIHSHIAFAWGKMA